MNYLKIVILNYIFFLQFSLYAYDANDHMYITYEAYHLLKLQNHCFPEMENRLGNLQDQGVNPWEKGKITAGAYREDQEDVVFHYETPPGFPFGRLWHTNSHFWNADEGDEALSYLAVGYWGHNDYWKNAYQKIRYYRDGDWRYENGQQSYINLLHGPGTYQYMYYEGLPQLYLTGRVWCESFTNWAGAITPVKEWRTLDWDDRNLLVWEILGRMCHLLQDQTVPAHVHNDVHPYNLFLLIWNQPDSYENWVQIYRDQINRYNSGNFIDPYYGNNDPIRFLFYTSNQLADHFPSDWRNNGTPPPEFEGDNNLPNGGTNYMLYQYYNELGSPPNTVVPSSIMQYNLKHAIRATAGLLYWFATSVGLQHYNSQPVLQSFQFNLPMQRVYARETGTLTANISNANAYLWQYYKCGSTANGCGNYSPLPEGLQIIPNNNKILIKVYDNYVNEQCSSYPPLNCSQSGLLRFTFRVTAINHPCWSTNFLYQTELMPIAGIRPPPPGGGGCPYIYVWNSDSTLHMTDNNLLHRSEFTEFANQDITDKYKLLVQPNLNNGKYSIQIGEYENDHDYIDLIKLYAVDHPFGTRVGVTENNQIIMYDTTIVLGTDDANLNGSIITPYIQYYYQGKKIVSGIAGDTMYAHYDSTAQSSSAKIFKKKFAGILNSIIPDSMALIGEMDREPIGNKGWGGVAYIFIDPNNHIDKNFAMRENFSEVIIPFSSLNDAVDHVEINWTSPFQVSYFSVVPVAYSGFDITELTLFDAVHSINNSDVSLYLLSKDNNYAELDSSDYLTIRFDSIAPPQTGWVRDFVIEVNGRYTAGSGYANLMNLRPDLNIKKHNFALHTNYPNPFNPKTLIKYDIGKNSIVKISVYNLLGQLINTIVNEYKDSGNYSVEFDGTNLPSGLYIYKIEAGDYSESKKMLIIK